MKKTQTYFLMLAAPFIFCAVISAQTQSQEQVHNQVVANKLSEKEIIECLVHDFTDVPLCSTVDIAIVARFIFSKNYTHAQLQSKIIAMQALAKKEGCFFVTKYHISAVIYTQFDAITCYIHFLLCSKYSTAIHEAGHAIAMIYLLQEDCLCYSIFVGTAKDESLGEIVGCNHLLKLNVQPTTDQVIGHLMRWTRVVDFYNKKITMLLSGGVAEQVFGLSEYTNLYRILDCKNWLNPEEKSIGLQDFLAKKGCVGDIKSAYEKAQYLIDHNFTKKTAEQIVKEQYYCAYQFILEHKNQVQILANYIMKHDKDTIFYDEVYDLLGVQRPLFDFEKKLIVAQKKQTPQKKSWFRSLFSRPKKES